MIDSFGFFVIWLAFAVLVVFAIIPFFVWAVRSGQFSRFDYAGRLALKSKIVEDKKALNNERNEDVSA
jgi:cbb3-type cytochrome oxidase maturation protein